MNVLLPPGIRLSHPRALENTVLAPLSTRRFRRTGQDDVGPVRDQWDALIAEMRATPTRSTSSVTPNRRRLLESAGGSGQEFRDFLISSITAEFSGCVLYAEMKKGAPKTLMMREPFRIHEPEMKRATPLHQRHAQDFGSARSRPPDKGQEIYFFNPNSFLCDYLSENRLAATSDLSQ